MSDPDDAQVTALAGEFEHVKALEPVALDPKKLAFDALKQAMAAPEDGKDVLDTAREKAAELAQDTNFK